MVNIVRQSVSDVDAALLLVEPIAGVGEREADLIERIRAAKVPAVLAINKCDTVEKASLLAVIDAYAKEYEFKAILPISAKTGEGVEELLAEVTKLAPEGPQLFPEDMITDQPERQLVAEILREKLLWCLEREVPHGTAVEITAFNEREDGVIDIDATIYCEKSSHKGIIIGKRGEMLKKISSMAREDCEKLLDSKVYLQTWVKVKENWRESNTLIRNFGYQ
ncbi:MAG: GTPase Era, partial [Oscillospiraceae bacterium]|nr:GTPase Era [Oscillospiraceae bacterium]